MKIKLPITEKFLWDLYKLLDLTDDIFSLMYKPSLHHYLAAEFYEAKKRYQNKLGKKRYADLMYRLKKRGYIRAPEWEEKSGIFITEKGFKKIFFVKEKIRKKELREDGKWEMVIFDIPEKRRRSRDIFRHALSVLGYKLLQKSIWVSPYDVLEKTKQLISEHDLEDEVKLLLIEEIKISQRDNEKELL